MFELVAKGSKKVICCAIVLSSLTINANAQDFNANIVVKNNVVTYSGASGIHPTKVVNALVIEGLGEPSENNILGIQSSLTEGNGTYAGEIPLSTNIEPGVYKVFVDSEFGSATKKFIVPDEAVAASILSVLNSKSNSTEFEQYFKLNSETLGIFSEDYVNSFSFVSNILFSLRPVGGYASARELCNEFTYNDVVYNLVNSNDISKSINEYGDALLIDADEYNNLLGDSKFIMNELLKNEDYTKAQFSQLFQNNIALADIKAADKWTTQKDRIIKHADRVGIDLNGTYKLIGNKDVIFQELFKKTIHTLEDVRVNFNSLTESCYNTEQGNANSNANSNSNQSSGGGGFVIVTSTEAKEEIKTDFSDIIGHWASAYINRLISKGSINGYDDGTFKPDNTITRAEFTKIIVQAFNIIGKEDNKFLDVNENAWYCEYISSASANSIVNGSNNHFYPNDCITRQDAAVIIYRILKSKNVTMTEKGQFSDQDDIAQYAKDAVSEMSGIGVINGNQGKFLPNNFITRAESAKIIAVAMDLI